MRRRQFITLLGGVATWPFASRAPGDEKKRSIAVLAAADHSYDRAFRNRLAELGWQEGRNVQIEFRSAKSDINRARSLADELAKMRPDIFFVNNTQMAQLINAKVRDIPIVFVFVPDPIGSGLVASFARPGGNMTGFTNFEPSIAGRWLQLLKDVTPGLNRAGILLHAENPTTAGYEEAIQVAGAKLGVQINPASVRDGPSIDAAIETFAREPNNGLIVPPSALSLQFLDQIIELAARHQLPAMYPYTEFVSAGGLMEYGIDRTALYQQAASYVDRILRGAKAGDLPVQAPTKFEFVINLNTAKALGLTVPRSILLIADQVIE